MPYSLSKACLFNMLTCPQFYLYEPPWVQEPQVENRWFIQLLILRMRCIDPEENSNSEHKRISQNQKGMEIILLPFSLKSCCLIFSPIIRVCSIDYFSSQQSYYEYCRHQYLLFLVGFFHCLLSCHPIVLSFSHALLLLWLLFKL